MEINRLRQDDVSFTDNPPQDVYDLGAPDSSSMARRVHRASLSVHNNNNTDVNVQQVESILRDIQNESQMHDGAYSLKFTVNPEWWRLFAYAMFWLMCTLAIIFARTLVQPYLANGSEDGSACGPFNRNDADFGVLPGEGFDLATQSHLVYVFGYSKSTKYIFIHTYIHTYIYVYTKQRILKDNDLLTKFLLRARPPAPILADSICANWDYSPSRELTAMFYPLFEYSLIVYLCLDFLATSVAMKRGEIEKWFWQFSRVLFPICIILCSQFRMIFVCLAYENVQQHTAGFLGLQWALVLVAIHNAGFVWNSKIAYAQLGGPRGGLRNTHIVITVYLICQIAISIAKLYATTHLVFYGYAVSWSMKPVGSRVAGQVREREEKQHMFDFFKFHLFASNLTIKYINSIYLTFLSAG